ncbi:MAG: hypothetical protein HQK77_20680 [Desulfobacterales bacterium]|nr:hypothetical protein [Desulfobacterales bacterium]
MNVKFFDSWGLEVGKEQEWMQLLDEELILRGTDRPVEDWFHSVFYCIAASGHKVEDFDTTIIKKFINSKYNVAVILTKADTVSVDEEKMLKDAIENDVGQPIPILAACSEEKMLRSGKSELFGKKEIELQVYNDFLDSIILRLPEHCVKVLEKRIDDWHENQKKYIDENTGLWNFSDIKKKIETEYNSFFDYEFENQSTIKSKIEKTLKLYGNFVQSLNYPPERTNVVNRLPIEETKRWDINLVDIIAIPPTILIGIVLPILGLRYLFFGTVMNKDEFKSDVNKLVTHLKKSLPKIQSEIEKALVELRK